MLQNAYFLSKIGADTAENEQHFAEILPKIGNYPTGRLTPRAAARSEQRAASSRAASGAAHPPNFPEFIPQLHEYQLENWLNLVRAKLESFM